MSTRDEKSGDKQARSISDIGLADTSIQQDTPPKLQTNNRNSPFHSSSMDLESRMQEHLLQIQKISGEFEKELTSLKHYNIEFKNELVALKKNSGSTKNRVSTLTNNEQVDDSKEIITSPTQNLNVSTLLPILLLFILAIIVAIFFMATIPN